MRKLREKRELTLASGDRNALEAIRRESRHLNHQLRASARKPA